MYRRFFRIRDITFAAGASDTHGKDETARPEKIGSRSSGY